MAPSPMAEVVTTLRNIAAANKENRAAISREMVTPQLVRLMTEKHYADEKQPYADRVKLAEDARKLAQSAGQLLYTLIIEGSKEVKDLIIGAISACCMPFQCCQCCFASRFASPLKISPCLAPACLALPSPARTSHTTCPRASDAPLGSFKGARARHSPP